MTGRHLIATLPLRNSAILVITVLIISAGIPVAAHYNAIALRFTPTLVAAMIAFAAEGVVSNIVVVTFLAGFVSSRVFFWTLGAAFIFSIPLSLWAMSAIQQGEEESCWLAKNRKSLALRRALQTRRCRVLFLVHLGFELPSSPRLEFSLLCSLSSAIFHSMMLRLVMKLVRVLKATGTMPSSPVLIAGIALEVASSTLLENNTVPIALQKLNSKTNTDAEKSLHTDTETGSKTAEFSSYLPA